MKLNPSLLGLGLVLALAACQPGAAEYTASESPKTLTLDNASTTTYVRFAPGSSRLLPADAARLRGLAASGGIAPSDRVMISAAGSPVLAEARFEAISGELLKYRIVASARPIAGVPANRALIETGRYLVTLPPCPNWSKPPSHDFTNAPSSNFGCATVTDLGLSVWNPADLAEGRPVGPTDAIPAAAAVQRYEADKVQLPATTALGPVAVTSGAVAGGGTGAGSAGTQP